MTSISVNGVRISFHKSGISTSFPVGNGARLRKNVDGSSSVTMKIGNTTICQKIGRKGGK